MKIQPIVLRLFVFSLVVLFVAACSGEKKPDAVTDTVQPEEAEKHEQPQDVTKTEAGKPQFTVDDIFQKQLATVFSSYVELKDAFVSSDAKKVKDESKETQEALAKVDMKLVTGSAHSDWMVYLGEMDSQLKAISAAPDLEVQRESFSKLSYSLYKAIKAFGLGGTKAYYDFCPMAFNDKGAYWLSDETKIRNPYFGDKMLTCGSVEETLQ